MKSEEIPLNLGWTKDHIVNFAVAQTEDLQKEKGDDAVGDFYEGYLGGFLDAMMFVATIVPKYKFDYYFERKRPQVEAFNWENGQK